MNKYMLKLFNDGRKNDCKIIKNLITVGILDYDYVIKSAIETKDAVIIYNIALNIAKEEDLLHLVNAICKTGEAEYIYYFAKKIKGAPIEILAEAICNTNDAKYIYYFAKDIIDSPIEILENTICKINDAKYIYFFALNVEVTSIQKLANAICKTGEANYIYYFARDVEGAPIDELINAIIKTNDAEHIYLFILYMQKINNKTDSKLFDALINLKAIHYLENFLKNDSIKDTTILNKIKCCLLNNPNPNIQYRNLIRMASNDSFEELKTNAEVYKELLGSNKAKTKKLKPE